VDEEGLSQRQAAKIFDISQSTLSRWKRQQRETGTLESKPTGGDYRSLIDTPGRRVRIRQIVEQRPDATYEEIREKYNTRAKQKVSRSCIVRAVKKMGITRKKNLRSEGALERRRSNKAPGFFHENRRF
jgi:transposase